MRDWDEEIEVRPRQRASSSKQPLVVRHTEENLQLEEVLNRLARLEKLAEAANAPKTSAEHSHFAKLDARTIVAVGAIMLSIAGYVVEDARSTSRQDTEIEATAVRVTNLEKIAATNTEARVRTEVELDELRHGQAEIKELLRAHEDENKTFRKK
jgi:hypothetical protein